MGDNYDEVVIRARIQIPPCFHREKRRARGQKSDDFCYAPMASACIAGWPRLSRFGLYRGGAVGRGFPKVIVSRANLSCQGTRVGSQASQPVRPCVGIGHSTAERLSTSTGIFARRNRALCGVAEGVKQG